MILKCHEGFTNSMPDNLNFIRHK